MFMISKVMKSI